MKHSHGSNAFWRTSVRAGRLETWRRGWFSWSSRTLSSLSVALLKIKHIMLLFEKRYIPQLLKPVTAKNLSVLHFLESWGVTSAQTVNDQALINLVPALCQSNQGQFHFILAYCRLNRSQSIWFHLHCSKWGFIIRLCSLSYEQGYLV